MISIIVFTVFAFLVIYGVIDLRRSKFSETQKTLILTVVGVLLSVSLLISALKQTRHLTFSLLKTDLNDAERRFSEPPKYLPKYNLIIPQKFNEGYYPINYPHYNDISPSRRQKIIYSSSKNQGASTFLLHLTKKLQARRIPAFYLKLEADVYDETELLDRMWIPSLKILENVIETWNRNGNTPYLVVDGVEHLLHCRSFLVYLAKMFEGGKLNFVGNTEDKRVIERLFTVFNYEQFSVREWIPPSYEMLSKIVPNSYFKRLPTNFHSLAQIQTASEEEILMKSSNQNREAIHYLGITDLIREIAGKEVKLSAIKNRISANTLSQALDLGILKVRKGIVYASGQGK